MKTTMKERAELRKLQAQKDQLYSAREKNKEAIALNRHNISQLRRGMK